MYLVSGHSSPCVNDYCICLNILMQGSLHPAKLLLRKRGRLVLEAAQSLCYFWVLSQLLYFKQQSTVWGRYISPKWPCLMWLDIYGRHLTKKSCFCFFKDEIALRIVYLFAGLCPPIANAECFYRLAFLPLALQWNPSIFELVIHEAWIYIHLQDKWNWQLSWFLPDVCSSGH